MNPSAVAVATARGGVVGGQWPTSRLWPKRVRAIAAIGECMQMVSANAAMGSCPTALGGRAGPHSTTVRADHLASRVRQALPGVETPRAQLCLFMSSAFAEQGWAAQFLDRADRPLRPWCARLVERGEAFATPKGPVISIHDVHMAVAMCCGWLRPASHKLLCSFRSASSFPFQVFLASLWVRPRKLPGGQRPPCRDGGAGPRSTVPPLHPRPRREYLVACGCCGSVANDPPSPSPPARSHLS